MILKKIEEERNPNTTGKKKRSKDTTFESNNLNQSGKKKRLYT